MAVAVSAVVFLVIFRSMRTHAVPANETAYVATPSPIPPIAVPEPTADLPKVDLPRPAVAAPKTEAKQPEEAAVAAEVDPAEAIEKCKKAYASEKYKPIMATCGKALEVNPKEPQIMVMLAHAELDHGHSPAALRWAKKAVMADPKIAEAYVFIGEVEQELGHKDAAKAAYSKYLDLAPTGKFANDLRLIVKNL